MSGFLFDRGAANVGSQAKDVTSESGVPRLRMPQRDQIEFQPASLDERLDADHPVRAIWLAVCGLDLSHLRSGIKAVEGHVGRDATDPRLLLALWVYATTQAVWSARELARLCKMHLAYIWLCGGVSVNHHLLSDFRKENEDAWDETLTNIVGPLMSEGLVNLDRVSQDGMRVRAAAGKSSFHRKATLEKHLQEAREQVAILKRLAEENPGELSARQQAARERAAKERAERVEAALKNCEELQKQRETRAKKSCQPAREARASTTDPEARTMQFADGGYAPGYNMQFSTATGSNIIVGVDAVNAGNDLEQLPPMLDQLEQRYDRIPAEALVDGGFASKASIEQAEQRGCTVYAPLKDEDKQLAAGQDPYARKKGDSDAVANWRTRMKTAAAKELYKLRAQTAEWVNAMARNRGLRMMRVRGRVKCRIVALLYAITHNIMVGMKLRMKAKMG